MGEVLLAVNDDVRSKNLRGSSINDFEFFLPKRLDEKRFSSTEGTWVRLKEVFCAKISTVAFIKRANRSLWASALLLAHRAADADFYGPLLLAPLFCLCAPPRSGNGRSKDYTAARIRLFLQGDYVELLRTLPKGKFRVGANEQMGEGVSEFVEEMVNNLVDAGNTSKATKILNSAGVAPYGKETLEALRAKHPEGREIQIPVDLPPAVRTDAKKMREALKSFAPRTAPGPSGLRPEHLKHALEGDQSKELAGFVTSFLNRLLSGNVPLFMMPFFSSARLVPILKKRGSPDIRPVAIGETYRRLAGKCAWLECREEAAALLAPLQIGSGVPMAAEAIARASSVMFNNHRRDPDFVQLDVDVSNAFNEINREHFLTQVRERLPRLARFAYACYAKRSFLFYGEYVLFSSRGTQQGDILGGLFWNIGAHTVISKVKSLVPGLLLNVWYYDDGRLDGRIAEVSTALTILQTDFPLIGLSLNLAKCKAAFSDVYEEDRTVDAMDVGAIPDLFPPEIERVMSVSRSDEKRGYVTMGVPIGTREFVDAFFAEKLRSIRALHRRISSLRRLQTQLWLLRNCASVCKVMYWMRAMDSVTLTPHLRAFDAMQYSLLQEIVGVDFDPLDDLQARLPVSLGGLAGTRSAVDHAEAAFIAGAKNSESLVRELVGNEQVDMLSRDNAIASFNTKVKPESRIEAANFGELLSIEQKSLSIAVDKLTEAKVLEIVKALPDVEVRNLNLDRLLSIKDKISSAWLLAVPNPNLGLFMTNEELQFALQIRLGHVAPHTFRCLGENDHGSDRSGLEVLKCGKLQKVRHDVIVGVQTNIARAAGLHPTRENLGIFGDGSQSRPGDMVMETYARGSRAVMDVRVTNNKQSMFTCRAPTTAGRAAAHGERVKLRDWNGHCAEALRVTGVAVTATFIPLCADVYGFWTAAAREVFYEFAKRRCDFTGNEIEVEQRYIHQRISMALQRENARIMVAHRVRERPLEMIEDEEELVLMDESGTLVRTA
jgi:hypothetical protein